MVHDGRKDPFDDQMNRLAGQLRDQGSQPSRDLWPDIDRTISAAEEQQVRPLPKRRWDWWQITATVAAVFVLAAIGWWGPDFELESDRALNPVGGQEVTVNEESELDLINQALSELNLALAQDPESRSLANLALMLHQSRGRVMRQNTDLQF